MNRKQRYSEEGSLYYNGKLFIPEGVEPPAREIIELPELKIYYENFGTGTADNCIVAYDDGKVIGAVWTRIMNEMLALLKEKGYKQASLAVQKANYDCYYYRGITFRQDSSCSEDAYS